MTLDLPILALVLALALGASAQDMASSFARGKPVLLSSGVDANLAVTDGNDTTMWQSDACYPGGYLPRPAINALLWACNATSATPCTASPGSANLASATDSPFFTGTAANIAYSAATAAASRYGGAWLRLPLAGGGAAGRNVSRVGMRGIFNAAAGWVRVYLEVVTPGSATTAVVGPVLVTNSTGSYNWLAATGSWTGVAAVVVNASAAFAVTEVGAASGECEETAVVDLGTQRAVGLIRTRYWPGTALGSWLLAAPDTAGAAAALLSTPLDALPASWVVAVLDPSRLSALTLNLPAPVQARYLAVRHRVPPNDWAKVYVWGIDAWGPQASPSPPPSPSPPVPPSPTNWFPLAGTVQSFTYGGAVTVSSAADPIAMSHVADSDDNTQWQSDACYPGGYIARPSMNPMFRLCTLASSRTAASPPAAATPSSPGCVASTGSTNLPLLTDNDVYTGAAIQADPVAAAAGSQSAAFIFVSLPPHLANATEQPRRVRRVSAKAWWGSSNGVSTGAPVAVVLLLANGTRVSVGVLTPGVNDYAWVHFTGSWLNVVGVLLTSPRFFMLTELAVSAGPCVEWAAVDMGSVRQVGVLRFRYWAPDSASADLHVSADGVSWTPIRTGLDPNQLSTLEIYLPTIMQIRHMRLTHHVKEDGDWRKVYAWGLEAYDVNGRWGPPPPPRPQAASFRQLLGVNGIWGWGVNRASRDLVKIGKGPALYAPVASRGRNYHAMNWDVRSPLNNPKYDTMAKTGTDGQWWLDWDIDYVGWKAAGLKIDASFQFLAEDFPPASWGSDPTGAAYRLGAAFARHFGPRLAPANVSMDSVEVGNEPWIGYNASFYNAILRGFARGVKDTDPGLRLLPCALQAAEPLAEDANNGNFVGARITPDVAPLLDGLNLHVYSWYRDPEAQPVVGAERGVHPEHRGSSMNGLHNMLAWRDANMPGKPVWVTEWGWDAALPGETCDTSLCVSQHAQAVYAVRGLALLARKGVAGSHWFFYSNADNCTTVFCRSGLRGSNATGFPVMPVYTSLLGFMQTAGSAAFLDVLAETPAVYAYLLGAPGATGGAAAATHVLVWRPVAAGAGPATAEPTAVATLTLPRAPTAGWSISGAGAVAVTNLTAVARKASAVPAATAWNVTISAVPLLLKF
ncbi:hypothetical protein HXX76_009091 [Chlamydomonas incerta]|uniref:F5/8 type C domain-containing protein n=1 Tax=Chlamydomonas incerta TaxID=51695 RepID=A0A835T5X1_CHLIN|nr:hypothetical protein HXX76_009091 [Chlamydomonas incerta]|eukprot:KAG2432171.1 hypothetical protein HXX76_009091 [Chlamydomonas incerta]